MILENKHKLIQFRTCCDSIQQSTMKMHQRITFGNDFQHNGQQQEIIRSLKSREQQLVGFYNQPHVPSKKNIHLKSTSTLFSLHSALIHTSKVKHSSVTVRRCRNLGNMHVFPVFLIHLFIFESLSTLNHQKSGSRGNSFKKTSLRGDRENPRILFMNLKLTQMLFAKCCAFSKWNNFQVQPFPLSVMPISYSIVASLSYFNASTGWIQLEISFL